MQKKREFKQLTLDDRINIQIKYLEGLSFEKIANYLGGGRNKGTISREIAGKPARGMGKYQAHIAHEKALKKRMGKKTERMNYPGAELRGISDTYRSANKLGCERCIC
ncbi:MAG: hypothetical protein COZ29_02615, partial [Candidatus Moranbacteria bacterium CG_4_10_14_3_um_filter_45_9]